MAIQVTEPGDSPKTGVTAESAEQLAGRCRAALAVLYESSIAAGACASEAYDTSLRCVVGMLAALSGSEQIYVGRSAAGPLQVAGQILRQAAEDNCTSCCGLYDHCISELRRLTGFDIFCSGCLDAVSDERFSAAVRAMFSPRPDMPIDTLFFQTMPLSWIGQAYQGMLLLNPSGSDGTLEKSPVRRKLGGVYFTPPHLVRYVVQSALACLVADGLGVLGEGGDDGVSRLRVLDPAVGGGDFLAQTVAFLGGAAAESIADVSSKCVFGFDIDPIVVDIARFRVWAAGGFADGVCEAINSHIIHADALSSAVGPLGGVDLPGFDVVLGNPPYIASKNGLRRPGGKGQSDSYLLFLSGILDKELVRNGGMLSMVLPDPVLVRGNASGIRRRLVGDWTLVSLLHILGSFPEAGVANVVPLLRNSLTKPAVFCATRIERAADQHAFAQRPIETVRMLRKTVRTEAVLAQDRCELLYLLEDGSFGDVIRQIHGPGLSMCHYEAPFAPLRSLNVAAIYRGEEVGKAAIREAEEGLPMLLGGQSIQPFEVTWEGRRIPESRIAKPRERYARTKILIQKSSPRIIAALDRVTAKHPGYVFPQSVYAVELRYPGMDEYYLLCLLNSQMMSEYIWRTATAYKMVQPQLEIEDIKALPIRVVQFTTPSGHRREMTSKGLDIFEREQARSIELIGFPELDNFAAECLGRSPENSDVVHDVVSHLGRVIVDLTARGRKSPDPQTMRRLEAAKAAADTIVWRLYSSQPLQMSLPW